MDASHYTRNAMAGWVFLAVFGASLADSNAPLWSELLASVRDTQAAGTLLAAFVAAVIGVGAPPAVGLVLERIVSLVMAVTRRNQWNYVGAVALGTELRSSLGTKTRHSVAPEPAALFHVAFYTHANDNLIAWARRRRASMYGSLTGALAITLALAMALALDAFSWSVAVTSGVLGACLIIHGLREQRMHRLTIEAWSELQSPSAVKNVAGS